MAKPTGVLTLMVPLMLVLFISNLDQTIVATALPSIGRGLHDLGQISWVATARFRPGHRWRRSQLADPGDHR